MTVALSILGYMLATLYVNDAWALGFLLGAVWSMANLFLTKGLVERAITPHTVSVKSIVLYAVLKFPLLYAGGYFILSSGTWGVWALMTGFALPFVVIVLKAGGRLLLGIEGSGTGRSTSPAGTTPS